MSVAVLQSRAEIAQARRALAARGVSRMTRFGFPLRVLHRFGLARRVPIGDRVKSWDVEKSATFLTAQLPRSARVLDLGAYASELPYVLRAGGFRSVAGIDTNATLHTMPGGVRHVRGDFHRAPFRERAFDAITAISVIEHGLDAERLFAEVSRLLHDGGLFVASTDYWPDKIDTSGLTAFGVSWTIFSRRELLAMLDTAARFDLHPAGAIELDARDAVIRWNERRYTFAWLALRKGRR